MKPCDWQNVTAWMREHIDEFVTDNGIYVRALAQSAALAWDRGEELMADPDHWIWRAAESTKAWYESQPKLKVIK